MSHETDQTLNVLFITIILTTALWGIGTLQLYHYYYTFGKVDRWGRKLFTFIVWALDTAHQVCIIKPVHTLLVSGADGIFSLSHFENTTVGVIIFAAFVDALVQGLFTMRIWYLSRRNFTLTGIIISLVIAQFISTTMYFATERNLTELLQLTFVDAIEQVALAIIVVTDIMIASVLVYLLYSIRSGLDRTDSVINRLIIYTVNTGLITGLCAASALITGYACPGTFLPNLFLFMIPKLYVNCMLASLNSREKLRTALESTEVSGCDIDFAVSNPRMSHILPLDTAASICETVPGGTHPTTICA